MGSTTDPTTRGRPGRAFAALAALAAVLGLGACSRATTVEGAWVEGVPRSQPFTNVLVIGVTADYNTRCRFERALVAKLRSSAVQATASCSHMNPDDELTKAAVVPLVAKLGVDGVVSTQLVTHNISFEETGSADTRGRGFYKPTEFGYADSWYGTFGVPVVYGEFVAQQTSLTLQRDVTVHSNVYDVRSEALVYGIETRTENQETQPDVLAALSGAIAGRLREAGLVR